jgi:Kef-type K+ transport system membrane component KefB
VEHSGFFLNLILVLLFARLFGELANRMQVPALMGEMLAGILLGPSLLGWVTPGPLLETVAQFGLILLLFEVGLETDLGRLKQSGGKAVVVAIGGFIMPFVAGFALAYWVLDIPMLVSLFIGGTLTATSIGVTVGVLRDLRRQHSHEAHIVLGAAVFDDVLGVVLLAILFEFSLHQSVDWVNASKVLMFIIIFVALAPVVAKMFAVMARRFHAISRTPGFIPTMMVSLVLGFALLAHVVGAPELIGGFAAGLALSRRFFLPFGIALHKSDGEFVDRIGTEMKPIIQLFTPVFFATVGLSLNLGEVEWSSGWVWQALLLFILLAMLSKFGGAVLIRDSWAIRGAVGLAMIPRAEVGLVFAELGKSSGIFSEDIYTVMLLTIVATTVLPPFMLKAYYRRYFPPPEASESR